MKNWEHVGWGLLAGAVGLSTDWLGCGAVVVTFAVVVAAFGAVVVALGCVDDTPAVGGADFAVIAGELVLGA
jgi:hypothetical protein